jgi:hypothetical protein
MLRIVRIIGMTLVAMLAMSGVASAHFFNAEKAGSVTRVTNKTQIFTAGGSIPVECTTDKVTNSNASIGNQLTLKADVSYSGCTVTAFKFAATVTTAKYLFSADETANLENTIVISVPVAGCDITVKAQNNLGVIKYKTNKKDIIVEPNVKSIKSEGSGGECGTGASSNGTYTGTTEVESSGQTIKWS